MHQFMVLPKWPTSSSAPEHLLVLGAMGNRPGCAVAVLESRCGQDGQPLWPSAGTFSQAASGHLSLASAGPWVGGSSGAAAPVGFIHVCYETATLQKQDSNSSTPSGTPPMPLRAETPRALTCSLKNSTSVGVTNVCM